MTSNENELRLTRGFIALIGVDISPSLVIEVFWFALAVLEFVLYVVLEVKAAHRL